MFIKEMEQLKFWNNMTILYSKYTFKKKLSVKKTKKFLDIEIENNIEDNEYLEIIKCSSHCE